MSGGWYIVNKAVDAGPAQVTIYDDIGGFGVRAPDLLENLGAAQEVDLRINSGGGDVFEAVTIYNRLRLLRQVSVTVDGVAASAASAVAMAASPGWLVMAPHSTMMIHEAWATVASGSAAELATLSAVLDGLSGELARIYAARAGRPASFWRDAMRAESWYSAEEAVGAGLADRVGYQLPEELRNLIDVEIRAAISTYRFWARRRQRAVIK